MEAVSLVDGSASDWLVNAEVLGFGDCFSPFFV